MAGSATLDHRAVVQSPAPAGLLEYVPWPAMGVVGAVTCFVFGLYLDLAWHQSFGHDSFWIPPHILIYMCGVFAGVSCGYMILHTTFGHSEAERGASVKVLGFRAPLGSFMAAWGGIVMLTSAGFDNWWHTAYGLDAQLNSPPHYALWVGVTAVQVGGMVLLAGAMNRGSEQVRKKLDLLFIYLGATVLWLQLLLPGHRIIQHSAVFYKICNRVGLGKHWRCEQGQCGELNELPEVTFVVNGQTDFHRWFLSQKCACEPFVA